MTTPKTGIPVLGCGLAGAVAALAAADRGRRVTAVTKMPDLPGGNTP